MTRRSRHAAERATDREVGVVAAVLVAGSEKAAAHRLGLSHSTVKHHLASARSKVGATTTAQLAWILAPRLPAPGRPDQLANVDLEVEPDAATCTVTVAIDDRLPLVDDRSDGTREGGESWTTVGSVVAATRSTTNIT